MVKQHKPKQQQPPQIVTNQFFYSNNKMDSNSPVLEDTTPVVESANYTSSGSPQKRKQKKPSDVKMPTSDYTEVSEEKPHKHRLAINSSGEVVAL